MGIRLAGSQPALTLDAGAAVNGWTFVLQHTPQGLIFLTFAEMASTSTQYLLCFPSKAWSQPHVDSVPTGKLSSL